jgi:ATP-dependent exoDNAse (exonuclease V) beta subunit
MMSNLKIYKASAGSGKTYTLALEYIRELLVNYPEKTHRHILAVTFTKDATGEMKDRILSELYGLAFDCDDSATFRDSLSKALRDEGKPMSNEEIREKSTLILQSIFHDYSRLHITTIDSFFQKVLKNLARELGKCSRFNLEMDTDKVLSEAVDLLIEQANEDAQLLNWLMTYIENKLDDGSNWRIDRDLTSFSRCIYKEFFQEHEQELKQQIDENPNLFKQLLQQHTRVQNQCRHFFKTTFAALSKQLTDLGLNYSDFNRNGTVLNFFKALASDDPQSVDTNKATIEACRESPEKWPASKTNMKAEIIALATNEWLPLLNQSLQTLRTFLNSKMITENLHQLGLIWDITRVISRLNSENNRFMLSDTARFLNYMIDDSDAPFIFEKIGAEIRHVMIDEFQDTSRIQWENFKSLLSEILSRNLFSLIVGDVKQSIYRWRNGDWTILNGIGQELQVTPCTLDKNFRSERQIIDFNNQFFTFAASQLSLKQSILFGTQEESPFEYAYKPSEVVQQSPKIATRGYVSVDFFPDKSEDGKYEDLVLSRLLDQLQELRSKGIPAGSICILTRTNKIIIRIAEYLASQRESYVELAADHYLTIVSDEAFQLSSSPALRILIEAMRVLSNPSTALFRARLAFYLQEQGLDPSIVPEEQSVQLPLSELSGHLYRLFDLKQIPGQSNYMFSFYDNLTNYLRESPSDIHSFLRYWDEELQRKPAPSGVSIDGIRAITIHKSKGLQFHTVLLPFCDWELFPKKNPIVWCGPKADLYDLKLLPVKYTSKMADTVFSSEYMKETLLSWMDNLNLLYVAFTRAEHHLLILAKEKKDLESCANIKTVADLLSLWVKDQGCDSGSYATGALAAKDLLVEQQTDNLLKQKPLPLNIGFVSETFDPDRPIFKQSNNSREFVWSDDSDSQDNYTLYGNIMHALFSRIRTMNDIEQAVNLLIFDGMILPSEKAEYIRKVRKSIQNAHVEDWFSDKYKIYNECTILTELNGTMTHLRPDRILLSEDKTVIIDYKFGKPQPAHLEQMKRYIALLQKMNYPDINAFIWYVEIDRIQTV